MKCCKILVFQRRIWPTRHKLARNIVVIKMDALIVKHVFFQILIIWFNSDTLLTIKSHLFFHLDWIGSPIPLTAHVWKYKNV
jgi:hypothetical protein